MSAPASMREVDGQDGTAEWIVELLRGHILTQVVSAAARFRIADLLHNATMTDAQLSERTGIGIHQLRRFMRVLIGVGLVECVGSDSYRATAAAQHLRSDSGSLFGQALMAGGEYYDAWRNLDFSLRTGKSAFEDLRGHGLWVEFSKNPSLSASFARTMRWNTERALPEILDLCDLPDEGVIADLGAGDGALTSGILARCPGLSALVVEQAAMLDNARRSLITGGFEDRCRFISCDLLREAPAGADVYLIKSVIHNWDDDHAILILENCRTAMRNSGRICIIERAFMVENLLDAAVRDMVMLVLFGSRDRTPAEYGELLERSGFVVNSIKTGTSGMCVVEAAPRIPDTAR